MMICTISSQWQACSHRYIATLIAPPTQSLKSTRTVRTEYFSVYMMALLIGDIKFMADMILELLENFDKEYQGDLNSFKDVERLECLSAADISLRLNNRFEVDVDRVRAILKGDEALSQSELVFLANSAIESANRHLNKAEQTVKRKTSSSVESYKRVKTEGPTVSYKKMFFVLSKNAIHFILMK